MNAQNSTGPTARYPVRAQQLEFVLNTELVVVVALEQESAFVLQDTLDRCASLSALVELAITVTVEEFALIRITANALLGLWGLPAKFSALEQLSRFALATGDAKTMELARAMLAIEGQIALCCALEVPRTFAADTAFATFLGDANASIIRRKVILPGTLATVAKPSITVQNVTNNAPLDSELCAVGTECAQIQMLFASATAQKPLDFGQGTVAVTANLDIMENNAKGFALGVHAFRVLSTVAAMKGILGVACAIALLTTPMATGLYRIAQIATLATGDLIVYLDASTATA